MLNSRPSTKLGRAIRSRPTAEAYLIDHLKSINITPVSYDAQSIGNGISDKLRVLLQTLEKEKTRAGSFNEPYSGIVFVTRRDAVLALAAVLEHHPRTKGQESFRIGCLLGSSESSYRTAFLDITRKILRQPQAETLDEFRSGELNLIIATAVAEEGLDIQACGNVIRWDIPNNMASWAQSRGRARRKRSTFVLMFERGGFDDDRIAQFSQLEKDMVAQYNAERKAVEIPPPVLSETDDELELCEFKVESTGALLTLQADTSHLNHSPVNPLEETNDKPVVGGERRARNEELSTKMLADVVESLISAAYLHGGFDLGVSCAQLFDLGLGWRTLPKYVEMALSRVEHTDEMSTQLDNVERMLGYTFWLLVESLTHASYQYDGITVVVRAHGGTTSAAPSSAARQILAVIDRGTERNH